MDKIEASRDTKKSKTSRQDIDLVKQMTYILRRAQSNEKQKNLNFADKTYVVNLNFEDRANQSTITIDVENRVHRFNDGSISVLNPLDLCGVGFTTKDALADLRGKYRYAMNVLEKIGEWLESEEILDFYR